MDEWDGRRVMMEDDVLTIKGCLCARWITASAPEYARRTISMMDGRYPLPMRMMTTITIDNTLSMDEFVDGRFRRWTISMTDDFDDGRLRHVTMDDFDDGRL
jgi:hypothetical protein